MLAKVINLRLLRFEVPEARRIVAWNAESNTPMVAINDALKASGRSSASRSGSTRSTTVTSGLRVVELTSSDQAGHLRASDGEGRSTLPAGMPHS